MKALIAILVVLVLAIVGLGGFFLYRFVVDEQTSQTTEETESEESGVTGSGKGPLERMKKPNNEADVISNLAAAIEKNHDAVGWLEVPGTDINDVVMQGDDNRYYERRNADGFDDIYGCYFLDYECRLGARDVFSPNTVIYGHSDLKDSPDGPRFSQLFRFTDPEFAAAHPYLYLTTQEERYTFEIFSVFYTDISFDYIQVNIDDAATLALAQAAQKLSVHQYGVTPGLGDKLLTLSTCSVKYGTDGTKRFVVMARLCPVDFEAPQSDMNPEETEGQGTDAQETGAQAPQTAKQGSSSPTAIEAPPTQASRAENTQSSGQPKGADAGKDTELVREAEEDTN